MTDERFSGCMAALGEHSPHPPMTPQRMQLYRRVLADLTDDELERGTMAFLRKPDGNKYFPTSGELLNLSRPLPQDTELGVVFRDLEGLGRWDAEGGMCWSAAEVERKLGPCARAAFVAMGGSAVMKRLGVGDNRVFTMQRFFGYYREAQARGDLVQALPPHPTVRALSDGVAQRMTPAPQQTTAQLRAQWNASKDRAG